MNGVDVTNARHDDVIQLLTSITCSEFTLVVYRDPDHPLSPSASPRNQLFMPSRSPVSMSVESSSAYPESSAVAKRPSPGPQLRVSTSATTPTRNSAVSFVPRPTSAEVGKFPFATDAGKSPRTAVKTVTYSIGDSAGANVEPPMPLMKVGQEKTPVSSPRGPYGEQPVRTSQGVPCHDGNLLLVSPPAPPRASTGSGVSDLFDVLEKTYRGSQQSSSYDASRRSAATARQGSSLVSADTKRRSLEVRWL